MNNTTKIAIASLGLIGILITAGQIWQQAKSYTNVRFNFDLNEGRAQVRGDDTPEINIDPSQPLRLKHGNYRVTTSGENIQPDTQYFSIDKDTHEITVNFSYSQEFLNELLDKEKVKINSLIYEKYPKINKLYTTHNQALYHHGEYYGATLRFRNQSADNRDTLHILAQKIDGEWKLLSTPPVQVLSAPSYPDIPKEILRQINLGE